MGKNRYSDEELKEFKQLILEKIAQAKAELYPMTNSIKHLDDNDIGESDRALKTLEDGSATFEKEQANQLASRLKKHIDNLEMALIRIENKTYGICKETGLLISKERLRIVPHTTMSMEAKLRQD